MPTFGKRSRERLDTCHAAIQLICAEVIQYYDFSVSEGVRTAERQALLFKDGKSQLDGTIKMSYHQLKEGQDKAWAVDIVPYFDGKMQWNDIGAFRKLAGYMFKESQKLIGQGVIKHRLVHGGQWRTFVDMPHFQIHEL